MGLVQYLLPLLCMGLVACGSPDDQKVTYEPIAIESGDECHVCGMIITRFPGPKGEAFIRHQTQALKFCSTRDLFTWLLQPETASQVEAVFVHDMARNDWDNPHALPMIDARSAWFVVGSKLKGAMGPTLASFSQRKDAETFGEQQGGRVVDFSAIDLVLLESLDQTSSHMHH